MTVTEASESSATSGASGNKGVKRGLPLDGLPDAAASASSLWDIARLGTTSKMAYAGKLGRKSAAGGGWDRLVAVLRGFGLIAIEGDSIGLSALGQDLVNSSDPAKQLAARRTAMVHLKAYKELVASFDGTAVPDKSTLASKLKFEYGKKDDFAEKAAQAFLDSLSFAEMVDAQGRVCKNGADAPVNPDPNDVEDDAQADAIDDAFESEDDVDVDGDGDVDVDGIAGLKAETDRGKAASDLAEGVALHNGPAAVSISVTLDLSRYRADEVLQILKALKG